MSEFKHPAGELAQSYVESGDFGVWKESFDLNAKHEQLEEDHHAWHNVTGLLITIVTIGLILASTTVILCATIAV